MLFDISMAILFRVELWSLVLQRDFILQRDFGYYNETLRFTLFGD